MSRDTHLVDKSRRCKDVWSLDNLCTNNWLSGHVPGAESAAAFIMNESTQLFVKGDTAKAVILRDAANSILSDLVPKLKARAEEEKKERPDRVSVVEGEGE